MKQHLSDDTLRALKPPADKPQLVVFDTELKGFGVVVGQRNTTFIVNRRIGKKLHREALGAWTGRGGELNARAAAKEAAAGTLDGLPTGAVFPANPTIAVVWNKEGGTDEYVERRREPVPWSKLHTWKALVDGIKNPVRRDYNLVVLLTGLRRNDAG